jgi:hypothetical protein
MVVKVRGLKRNGNLMKTNRFIFLFAVFASSVSLGYWFHGHAHDSGTILAAKTMPQLDYFIVPESFSRVENTRNNLEGLCVRLRLEAEERLIEQRRLSLKPGTSAQTTEALLDHIIRDLEDGMSEFSGTDQEVYVAEDLLCALKRREQFDRWVMVYLKLLYEHPTHPGVTQLAAQAVTVSKLVGREKEVLAGLNHLAAIPLDFPGKDKAEAVLNRADESRHLTSVGGPPAFANQ